MSKNSIITIIIVVVLALGGYLYMQNGDSSVNPDSGLVVDQSSMQISSVKEAPEILQTLDKLSSLKIDDSIFNSAVFRSLQPSDVSSPTWTPGRSNPFAPLNAQVKPLVESQAASSTTKKAGTLPKVNSQSAASLEQVDQLFQ
ncbi:MAG: hypothetical protein WCO30_00870 [bacterium]